MLYATLSGIDDLYIIICEELGRTILDATCPIPESAPQHPRHPACQRPKYPIHQPAQNSSTPGSITSIIIPSRLLPKISARTKLFNEKLDVINGVINGVIIPSRLLPEILPNNYKSKANAIARLLLFCRTCEGAFAKRYHFKSHFATCVSCDGNSHSLIPLGYTLVLFVKTSYEHRRGIDESEYRHRHSRRSSVHNSSSAVNETGGATKRIGVAFS